MTMRTTELTEIWIDEQTSMAVTINTVRSSVINNVATYLPRDLTGGRIKWVASFGGKQKIKKTTETMLVMLSPQTSTYVAVAANSGQKDVQVQQVSGFGPDGYGRPILSFVPGDTVRLTNGSSQTELCTIDSINSTTLTMVGNLTYSYGASTANTCNKIISSFEFQMLPGDTILPPTKSYGTPVIWEHMAICTWDAPLSPGNIYQAPTTVVVDRGRLFIIPILDMG